MPVAAQDLQGDVSSNVLAALPKSAHPGAKSALAQIYNAEDKDQALKAVKAFEADYFGAVRWLSL